MNGWSDDDFRRVAFDYVRGDLGPQESEAVEQRMAESPTYREYVRRIDDMLGAARNDLARTPTPQADALFGRIEAALHAPTVHPATPEFPTQEVDFEDVSVRRPWALWVAAAAVVVACASLFFVVQRDAQTPAVPQRVVVTPKTVSEEEGVAKAAPEPRVTVEPVDGPDSDVRLYASRQAKYEIEGALDKRIRLKDGTLVVEFVPEPGVRLTLSHPNFEVRVVGTVFYASTDGAGLVGVVAGEVLVTTPGGGPVAVKPGQEFVVGEGLRNADPDRVAETRLHVDVERHVQLLEARELVKDLPRQPSAPPTAHEVALSVEDARTRDEANRLMREGKWEEAAGVLEKLLADLSPTSAGAGAIRLDLARLYLKHLNRPQQAALHLKRFVVSRPRDPATPLARQEYCRIVEASGRQDALCVR